MSKLEPIEMPRAPGFYWWRDRLDGQSAWTVLEVRADPVKTGELYVVQEAEAVYQGDNDPVHPWHGEWWPDPIEPPA